MPLGTLWGVHVCHPSEVASTTGTPLASLASAQQAVACGHDMADRLVRPLDDTVWLLHVLPPSVVARIKPELA